MIRTENLTINERAFVRTYSDEGKYVVREGISYEDAIDPAEFNRQYTEGDYIKPIAHDIPDDTELTEEETAEVLLGGSL